ncbi:hypothetical protein FRC05_001335 [Tulasnella sp. 425]|nr:hypothetical protein FRC05_001335 [Tulasnella sp. 425]
MTLFQTLLIATTVQTPSLGQLQITHDQLIVVDLKGYIAEIVPKESEEARSIIEKASKQSPPVVVSELPRGSFLLPTFVDLHLHAPQFLYLGSGLHLPLMKWLNEYAYKAEERLDADPELANRVYARLAERLLEAGTGAVLAFGTIKTETNLILAEVMQSKGVRAFVGKLSMDISSRPTYVEPSADASLEQAERFICRCREIAVGTKDSERLIHPVITPRFVPTCSDELLHGLGKLAQAEGVHIQSHLAEARDQVDWVRSTRGAEDIDIFDKAGLLTPRTIQAHCTFLQPPELARMQASGASIAHCPLSNAYFSSKPFPLREALSEGVTVGLGSDVAGGYQIDIMSAMRSAVSTSRMRDGYLREAKLEAKKTQPSDEPDIDVSIDWKEALFLATQGGADALGLLTGSFKPGSFFDAQRIDLINQNDRGVGALDFFDTIRDFQIDEDAVEKWWCLGDNRNRRSVWIQGRQVYNATI